MKIKTVKFAAILLAFLLLTGSLAACRTKKMQEEMEEKTLSDDLFSYELSIDGHVYSLPCPVSEFEEHGWAIFSDSEPAVEFLDPGETDGYCSIHKKNKRIEVELYNSYPEKAKLSACMVVAVRATASKETDILLPGGLVFDYNINKEKVLDTYGEPAKKIEYKDTNTFYYILGYNHMIQFNLFISPKVSHYSYVYIANRHVENDQAKRYRSTIDKVDISDELESCQVYIDGHVFTDPFSFTEFKENGWRISDGFLEQSVEPKNIRSSIWFDKGDNKIETTVYNPSEQKQPAKVCLITKVKLELIHDIKYYILPGNFIFDRFTTMQDLIDQYGQPDERDEQEDYIRITYLPKNGGQNSVEFVIAKEDGHFSPTFSTITLVRNVE